MAENTELDEDLQGLLKALIVLVIIFGIISIVVLLFGGGHTEV